MISEAKSTAIRPGEARSIWPEKPRVTRGTQQRGSHTGLFTAVDVPTKPEAGPAGESSQSFSSDLARQITELRGYAIWLCRSSSLADDLIQETLLNAWSARDRFQPGTNLKAWCTTILRNIFFSYKRRSWRTAPLPDDLIATLSADEGDPSHKFELLALRRAIELLPVEQREAILLVGVGSESYIDAARVCGCAVGTIKSRVSRARVRLTELMSGSHDSLMSDQGMTAGDALSDLMDQFFRLTETGRKDREDINEADAKLLV
jgi:RNA polymerase sigma-70 factor (ECF subfamily)